jgi:transcriptional regulator with XRE-family HTH domain
MELMVRIAKVFEVSVDFLIRDDKNSALSKIKNQELLNQLEQINDLPEEDQKTVVSFLDAFIKRRKFIVSRYLSRFYWQVNKLGTSPKSLKIFIDIVE